MKTTRRRLCARAAMIAAALAATVSGAVAQVRVPGDFNSIQAAILGAPDGSTIEVEPGTYREVLVIASTNKSLTIRGVGGKAATIVDAGGAGLPAITILQATGTIVIEGLTFRNASATDAGGGFLVDRSSPSFLHCVFEWNAAIHGGGGALIASNATFAGCTFRHNTAQMVGGGVYINGGSRPVFTACEILNNTSGTAGPVGGSNGAGGGMFSLDSSPTVRGGRISGNTARTAGGGIFHRGSYAAPQAAALSIEDVEIGTNQSNRFSSASSTAEAIGGGVHIEDQAIATLTRVRVIGNTANRGAGLHTLRARYDIVDSIVEQNTARPIFAGAPQSGVGGGIAATYGNPGMLLAGPAVNLTRSLVRANTAEFAGGGIATFGDPYSSPRVSLTMNQSIVARNSVTTGAGGLYLNRTNAVITSSLIMDNHAWAIASWAGGIRVTDRSALTMTETTLAGNFAASSGGGLMVTEYSSFEIARSRVYGNTTQKTDGGGGVWLGSFMVAGRIVDSIVADNRGYQIVDSGCNGETIEYSNNTITASYSSSDLYTSSCEQPISDIAQFNAKPNASDNNSSVPRFVHVMAAPGAGARFAVMWAVARPELITITNVTYGRYFNATGSEDVTPVFPTSFTLNATAQSSNGGAYAPVSVAVSVVQQPLAPPPAFRQVQGDYDGDGKSDIVIFRPLTGMWYLLLSSSGFTGGAGYAWGAKGDIPAPGDYDGDGLTDPTVYRPSTGHWFVLRSSAGFSAWSTYQWGTIADVPVPADYDGDGRTDIAVRRPSNGSWYILKSGTGFSGADVYLWDLLYAQTAAGDFDGDGRSDLSLFESSSRQFKIASSLKSYRESLAVPAWASTGDIAVTGDYDGDTTSDVALYRPSNGGWYIRPSSSAFLSGLSYTWGAADDVPVPGDYDGDGKTDIAVYRPSTAHWFLLLSTTNYGAWETYQWGSSGDIPVSPLGPIK